MLFAFTISGSWNLLNELVYNRVKLILKLSLFPFEESNRKYLKLMGENIVKRILTGKFHHGELFKLPLKMFSSRGQEICWKVRTFPLFL